MTSVSAVLTVATWTVIFLGLLLSFALILLLILLFMLCLILILAIHKAFDAAGSGILEVMLASVVVGHISGDAGS